MTPALTPNSMVSTNWRRDSASSCACRNAVCCDSRSRVMLLKARERLPISSSAVGAVHPHAEIARRDLRPDAGTSRAMGPAMPPAAAMPSETAPSSTTITVSK